MLQLLLSLNISFFIMQMSSLYLHKVVNIKDVKAADAKSNASELCSTNKQLSKLKIEEWKRKVPTIISNIPKDMQMPNKNRPFVYFHPRKSGGTSMRNIIYQMAHRAGIVDENIWIPCSA